MHQAYFVYKITCSVNEKSYIGISVDPQRRLRQHRNKARIGSGYALHNAMRKHGVDTFTMEVLMEVSTEEDALQMEEKLILENNTVAPAGYNLTVGGETPKGNFLSEQMTQMWASKSPEEMSAFKEKMKTVGANISEETRQKRSAAAKAQHADPEKEAQMKATLIAAGQDPERRKGNSERAKARWADPAFKAKVAASYTTEKRSKASLGKRAVDWSITDPEGNTFNVHNLKQWCEQNGLKSASVRMAAHRGSTFQGYMFSRVVANS